MVNEVDTQIDLYTYESVINQIHALNSPVLNSPLLHPFKLLQSMISI
jgi:hypothetical protein